jgi:hypothetical protein
MMLLHQGAFSSSLLPLNKQQISFIN